MANELTVPKNYNDSYYLVKRLFIDHMRPYLRKVILAVICMIFVAITTAAFALIMESVMDDIFINKDINMLANIVVAVALIFLVKGSAMFGQNYIMGCLGQRIIADMQIFLYKHLLNMDIAQVTGESSGKIISRFTNDINTLRASITIILTGIARDTIMLIFLVGAMFYQSFTLAIITFAAFPVAIYPIIRLGKRMRKISNSTQEGMGEFTERLDETFRSAKLIKAYQQENFEVIRASNAVESIYKLYKKATRNKSAASPLIEVISGFAIAAVVWYGGMQVIDDVTTGGKFISFITAAMLAYKPAKTLSSMNTTLQDGLAAARRIFILLDTRATIVDKDDAINLLHKENGSDITFSKVKFSYNEEKTALKGLDLEIKAGSNIALVGPSGGGKSTVMNLLLRFYDIDSGIITIDDHDIRNFTISSLRENIAYVGQDINLFDDTVAANIAYGKPDATIMEIEQAAKTAAADEFIKRLPDGYNTLIGQDGTTLSGGQRQRISIARAMLKTSSILLLDEATSALDKISEGKIQNALEKLMKNRTTIVIAHRLSTIEKADKIYVIKGGKVVESGKHSTLLRKNGEYTKLHKGFEAESKK